MGGMMSMLDKLPGMQNLPDHVKNQVDDKMFQRMEAMINSMTFKERQIRPSLKDHVNAVLLLVQAHKCRI